MNNGSPLSTYGQEKKANGKNYIRNVTQTITGAILVTITSAVLYGLWDLRNAVVEHTSILAPIGETRFRDSVIEIYREQKHVLQDVAELKSCNKVVRDIATAAASSCSVLRAELDTHQHN